MTPRIQPNASEESGQSILECPVNGRAVAEPQTCNRVGAAMRATNSQNHEPPSKATFKAGGLQQAKCADTWLSALNVGASATGQVAREDLHKPPVSPPIDRLMPSRETHPARVSVSEASADLP